MQRDTRGSAKRRRDEERSRHVAETSEVADSIARWIMLQTSERPDDFVTEDALLRIMGRFDPREEETMFWKLYHRRLTDRGCTLPAEDGSQRDSAKLARCHAAVTGLKNALNAVASARRTLDEEIDKLVKEMQAPR